MTNAEFQRVYDFGNLYAGFLKARRGKRGKASVAKFEANLLEAICLLSEMLKNKTYRPSDYFVFRVYEPKERVVMTNAFKDKVVQHSLCDNILEPAFSRAFIRDNYASQRGRGTHDGLYRLEEFMRSYYFSRKASAEQECREEGLPRHSPREVNYADGWVLKCDISKYFYSIQHEPLKKMVRQYVHDSDLLWLVDMIIDSTPNPGIPIGNQTSQWFAVMYLSGLDHFIKEKLGVRYYGRYMDDFYLIHEDKAYLQYCRKEIERYVARLGLTLNNKTNIFPLRNGIDFLGFHSYLTDSGKVIRKVRRASKSNEQRKLKKQRALLDRGRITLREIEQSYGSWRSHAEKGNCYHLIRETDRLFKTLFAESTLLDTKKKPDSIGESYFCGYIASPEEVRKTLSDDKKHS
ncbi:RNA-directed DNA polymerase [Acutalibacter muris]|uniref:RNA-directed DNA polymerase n=1 Tax=Acutalibacter muris TaxID=1796620 RepID=UPI0020CD2051|nr:RNA-directed DNA polymerase [Acutalibacter muris]